MKQIVIMLLLLIASTVAKAQSTLVATLSHDGEIHTFYTKEAFKQALTAASDGDIITLSSGTFTSPTYIDKNVTIRGSGMILEDHPTIIMGGITTVEASSNGDYSLVLEGLFFGNYIKISSGRTPKILKCWFDSGISTSTPVNGNTLNGWTFLHCIMKSSIGLTFNTGATAFSGIFLNCVLIGEGTPTAKINNSQFYNSIIFNLGGISRDLTLYNSIIINNQCADFLHDYNIASNCIYIGSNTSYFSDVSSNTNSYFPALTPVFKEGGKLYELLDDLKNTWLGNDGSQVGIYGGNWPFDPTTSNPRITKFKVANETTDDGKLQVEIEVSSK